MKRSILKSIAFTVMVAAMLPVVAQARTKLTLDQAVRVCTERAVQFGRQPYGRLADSPPEHRVQDEYRACVYANAGQYPTAKVKYRESVLTLLRDAF